ncbi:hypothetical protein Q5X68_01905 [Acinetobacter baumannii]|nr:hypothetical protein [Acinetobacter baumannii]MDC5224266.1 hypothetical protein [Acinetobacter baumannii]MDO7474513.1 hypothetical protein [Acinetobacter baumannii]
MLFRSSYIYYYVLNNFNLTKNDRVFLIILGRDKLAIIYKANEQRAVALEAAHVLLKIFIKVANSELYLKDGDLMSKALNTEIILIKQLYDHNSDLAKKLCTFELLKSKK